ncbi:MFS transporter [Hyalangium rubrum]|uniref:MFS transporter n=1 Tax=Hyalangium rubrum TaxID=3103134 RepID=A0ABU5H9L0_9BACT|nr:MFS transporter [Hyalangium sp. s54d21]MDY7230165.1 MFS transporter [Hyalangium sp. s54d21]
MSTSSLAWEGRAEPSAPAARAAVSAIFFVNGFAFASWVPHIPTVQARLGLGAGQLGVALLGMAVGSLVSMPLTGGLVARWGSRAVTLVTSVLLCALVVLPVHAPSLSWLAVALMAFGAATGAMGVAMNAHAVAVERKLGRPVMSSFHGLFSLGGLVGSGGSILALSSGLTPSGHMMGAGALGLLIVLGVGRMLLPGAADEAGEAVRFALPRGPLLGLGGLAFFVLVVEGAMADWSAVYLRQSLRAEAGLAGLGYAVFSLAMSVGRLTGDRLVTLFSPERLVRVGGALAACGLGGALLLHHPLAAVVGFCCVGLGLSNLIPVLFSAASRTPGSSPGVSIASVSTAGYCGFLVGPPLVGFLADELGLPLALGLLVVFLAVVGLGGALVRPGRGG